MQQQSRLEQDYTRRINEQITLLEEKDFFISLLGLAIDVQIQKKEKNVSIHPDQLREVIKYIKKLWSYCIKLDEENIHIRNIQQQDLFSSIIIYQSDETQMQEVPGNKARQIKKLNRNNIILEINEKMAWLNNFIKSSSLLSNKLNDHSNLSEVQFNLFEEQIKLEDFSNQDGNHSSASTVGKKSLPTLEELKSVKVLYQTIVQYLEQIFQEHKNCEQDIKTLKNKISEQSIKINNLQNIIKNKNQEFSTNQFKGSKPQTEDNPNGHLNGIHSRFDQLKKIPQLNNGNKEQKQLQ